MNNTRRLSALKAVFLFLFFAAEFVFAAPVAKQNADMAVRGWLNRNSSPMGVAISRNTDESQAISGTDGRVLYYIINLNPRGFVILSADDEIEPVIAFSATGYYDASQNSPLKEMLARDMHGRLESISRSKLQAAEEKTQKSDKWQSLLDAGSPNQYEGGVKLSGLPSVSDVRVTPLLQSKWGQGDAAGGYCYNYYTPNHYPTGCVATAMSQVMRYHSWPTAGIGVHSFLIYVNGSSQYKNTRGGNGSGGAYNWSQRAYDPAAGMTTAQREAIGALCSDAGVSVGMSYTSGSSSASTTTASQALKSTFFYTNSIFGDNFSSSGDAGLWGMMNADLDAALPVVLGISGSGGGHAVVADGYGYTSSTMYHHLNMGWAGLDDAWYQLPAIGGSFNFNVITDCVYNIYTSGTGEIISGRITSLAGAPLEGVVVTAYQGVTAVKQATTNSRGIYALKNLPSGTQYRISAVKSGYVFVDQMVSTGLSQDWNAVSGNKWGINFNSTNPMPPTAMNQTVDANLLTSKSITIVALDDNLPNPPAAMTYIITSLPRHGTLSEPGIGQIVVVPYTMAAGAHTVLYTPCQYFGGQDTFDFKANDGGTSPTGGDSNIATVTMNVDNKLYSEFGAGGSTATNTMINTEKYACRSQVIYFSSDIGSAKTLTDLSLNFTDIPPLTLRRWTIRMQNTDWTVYPYSYDLTYMMLTDGWTQVYQGDLALTSTGWHNFHFQMPFEYNGIQNLLIDFSFDNLNVNSTSETGWYLYSDVGTFRSLTIETIAYPHADPLTWDFWAGGGSYSGGGRLPSIKLIGTVPIDPIVGDFDLSCEVKFPDFAILAAAWLTQQGNPKYNPSCDISSPKNNTINIADVSVFADNWLQNY